ncbi:MAG: DUF2271 domain-containing protein [Planctomycetota bacterium]
MNRTKCWMVCLLLSGLGGSALFADATQKNENASLGDPGLHVSFELNRPRGRVYRKPYVAVWLEDDDGFPVKTGVLWWMTEQPGPRWHRDLTRWYRNDRLRKSVEKTDLVDGISGATRGPGQYQTHFDGTDNAGKRLPNGKYFLCLEAAREKGTYKIIRHPFVWSDQPIASTELSGNLEISQASFSLVPLAPE